MNAKMGRPKVNDPKDIRFSIRIDAGTKNNLDRYCSEEGITKAEAIRTGIDLLLKQRVEGDL